MAVDGARYRWTQAGIDELKDYMPKYKAKGCPKPGDPVLQWILDEEVRLGFGPSWHLDEGHWAKEVLSEEEVITSVYPPLSPNELAVMTQIKCSLCGEQLDADAVEQHSRRCAGSGESRITEEEIVTSVYPPLSPSELDGVTKIKCSVCGTFIEPESVAEHSRTCLVVQSSEPIVTGIGTQSGPPGPCLQEIGSADPAWHKLANLLQEAGMENIAYYRFSLRLKRLWKIRYHKLLQQCEARATSLGASTQLFHPSSLIVGEKIARDGFALPNSAGTFGRGISFSACPLKAASEAPEDSWLPLAKRMLTRPWAATKKESGHILVCDVYLGKTMTLRSKRRDLDPSEDLRGGWLREQLGLGDYDSVYAPGGFFGAVSVDEYVVYTAHQALPRYLLECDCVY